MKRLIALDLDGTLAESKLPIDAEMADLLASLSTVAIVAVISGGDWPQFEQQLVGNLPKGIDLSRWLLLSTSGTKIFRHDGAWEPVDEDFFSASERAQVLTALEDARGGAGVADERIWGDRIEDCGSQGTFSGLGQQAALGITTKIISGDNRHVTAYVAAQVGLDSKSIVAGVMILPLSDDALQIVRVGSERRRAVATA